MAEGRIDLLQQIHSRITSMESDKKDAPSARHTFASGPEREEDLKAHQGDRVSLGVTDRGQESHIHDALHHSARSSGSGYLGRMFRLWDLLLKEWSHFSGLEQEEPASEWEETSRDCRAGSEYNRKANEQPGLSAAQRQIGTLRKRCSNDGEMASYHNQFPADGEGSFNASDSEGNSFQPLKSRRGSYTVRSHASGEGTPNRHADTIRRDRGSHGDGRFEAYDQGFTGRERSTGQIRRQRGNALYQKTYNRIKNVPSLREWGEESARGETQASLRQSEPSEPTAPLCDGSFVIQALNEKEQSCNPQASSEALPLQNETSADPLSFIDRFSSEERSRLEKLVNCLADEQLHVMVNWMAHPLPAADEKKDADGKESLIIRKELLDGLEKLNAVVDPTIGIHAFAMIHESGEAGRASFTAKLCNSLKGLKGETQQHLVGFMMDLAPGERAEILDLTSRPEVSPHRPDRQRFIESLASLSDRELESTLSFMRSSTCYKQGSVNDRYDALSLAIMAQCTEDNTGVSGVESEPERIDLEGTVKSFFSLTGDNSRDRRQILSRLESAHPAAVRETLGFIRDPDIMSAGHEPFAMSPEERRDEIISEVYGRLAVQNALKSPERTAVSDSGEFRALTSFCADLPRKMRNRIAPGFVSTTLRQISSLSIEDGSAPRYDVKTGEMTIPGNFARNPDTASITDSAKIVHELFHAAFWNTISPEESVSKDTMAFASKVTDLYRRTGENGQTKERFFNALGARYKELGFRDKEIDQIKNKVSHNVGELISHIATLIMSMDGKGNNGVAATDAKGKRYLLEGLPPGSITLLHEWMAKKLVSNSGNLSDMTGQELQTLKNRFVKVTDIFRRSRGVDARSAGGVKAGELSLKDGAKEPSRRLQQKSGKPAGKVTAGADTEKEMTHNENLQQSINPDRHASVERVAEIARSLPEPEPPPSGTTRSLPEPEPPPSGIARSLPEPEPPPSGTTRSLPEPEPPLIDIMSAPSSSEKEESLQQGAALNQIENSFTGLLAKERKRFERVKHWLTADQHRSFFSLFDGVSDPEKKEMFRSFTDSINGLKSKEQKELVRLISSPSLQPADRKEILGVTAGLRNTKKNPERSELIEHCSQLTQQQLSDLSAYMNYSPLYREQKSAEERADFIKCTPVIQREDRPLEPLEINRRDDVLASFLDTAPQGSYDRKALLALMKRSTQQCREQTLSFIAEPDGETFGSIPPSSSEGTREQEILTEAYLRLRMGEAAVEGRRGTSSAEAAPLIGELVDVSRFSRDDVSPSFLLSTARSMEGIAFQPVMTPNYDSSAGIMTLPARYLEENKNIDTEGYASRKGILKHPEMVKAFTDPALQERLNEMMFHQYRAMQISKDGVQRLNSAWRWCIGNLRDGDGVEVPAVRAGDEEAQVTSQVANVLMHLNTIGSTTNQTVTSEKGRQIRQRGQADQSSYSVTSQEGQAEGGSAAVKDTKALSGEPVSENSTKKLAEAKKWLLSALPGDMVRFIRYGSLKSEDRNEISSAEMMEFKEESKPGLLRSHLGTKAAVQETASSARRGEAGVSKDRDESFKKHDSVVRLRGKRKPEKRSGLLNDDSLTNIGRATAQLLDRISPAPPPTDTASSPAPAKEPEKHDLSSLQWFNSLNSKDKETMNSLVEGLTGKDRQRFLKNLESISPEGIIASLSFTRESSFYKDMVIPGEKTDAFLLSSVLAKSDTGDSLSQTKKDELVKSTLDLTFSSTLDRNNLLGLMVNGRSDLSLKTMEFISNPVEKTDGKTKYANDGEGRKREITAESYVRLQLGNALYSKGGKSVQMPDNQYDSLAGKIVDLFRGKKETVSSQFVLNCLREVKTINVKDEAETLFDAGRRELTVSRDFLTNMDRMNEKEKSKVVHELMHVACRATLDKEQTSSDTSFAFVSKVTDLHRQIQEDTEVRGKFMTGLEGLYKKLGYDDKEIEGIKKSCLTSAEDLTAHMGFMVMADRMAKEKQQQSSAQSQPSQSQPSQSQPSQSQPSQSQPSQSQPSQSQPSQSDKFPIEKQEAATSAPPSLSGMLPKGAGDFFSSWIGGKLTADDELTAQAAKKASQKIPWNVIGSSILGTGATSLLSFLAKKGAEAVGATTSSPYFTLPDTSGTLPATAVSASAAGQPAAKATPSPAGTSATSLTSAERDSASKYLNQFVDKARSTWNYRVDGYQDETWYKGLNEDQQTLASSLKKDMGLYGIKDMDEQLKGMDAESVNNFFTIVGKEEDKNKYRSKLAWRLTEITKNMKPEEAKSALASLSKLDNEDIKNFDMTFNSVLNSRAKRGVQDEDTVKVAAQFTTRLSSMTPEQQKELLSVTGRLSSESKTKFLEMYNTLKPEERQTLCTYMQDSSYYKSLGTGKDKDLAARKAAALMLGATAADRNALGDEGGRKAELDRIDSAVKGSMDVFTKDSNNFNKYGMDLLKKLRESNDPEHARKTVESMGQNVNVTDAPSQRRAMAFAGLQLSLLDSGVSDGEVKNTASVLMSNYFDNQPNNSIESILKTKKIEFREGDGVGPSFDTNTGVMVLPSDMKKKIEGFDKLVASHESDHAAQAGLGDKDNPESNNFMAVMMGLPQDIYRDYKNNPEKMNNALIAYYKKVAEDDPGKKEKAMEKVQLLTNNLQGKDGKSNVTMSFDELNAHLRTITKQSEHGQSDSEKAAAQQAMSDLGLDDSQKNFYSKWVNGNLPENSKVLEALARSKYQKPAADFTNASDSLYACLSSSDHAKEFEQFKNTAASRLKDMGFSQDQINSKLKCSDAASFASLFNEVAFNKDKKGVVGFQNEAFVSEMKGISPEISTSVDSMKTLVKDGFGSSYDNAFTFIRERNGVASDTRLLQDYGISRENIKVFCDKSGMKYEEFDGQIGRLNDVMVQRHGASARMRVSDDLGGAFDGYTDAKDEVSAAASGIMNSMLTAFNREGVKDNWITRGQCNFSGENQGHGWWFPLGGGIKPVNNSAAPGGVSTQPAAVQPAAMQNTTVWPATVQTAAQVSTAAVTPQATTAAVMPQATTAAVMPQATTATVTPQTTSSTTTLSPVSNPVITNPSASFGSTILPVAQPDSTAQVPDDESHLSDEAKASAQEEKAEKEAEAKKKADDEAARKADEAKRLQEDIRKKETEAKKLEEEARKKADEAKKHEEEARVKETETKKADEEQQKKTAGEAKTKEAEQKKQSEEKKIKETATEAEEQDSVTKEQEAKKKENTVKKESEPLQNEALKIKNEAETLKGQAESLKKEAITQKEELFNLLEQMDRLQGKHKKVAEEILKDVKPQLGDTASEVATSLSEMIESGAFTSHNAKEGLKTFISLLGKSDGPEHAAEFLARSCTTFAGSNNLVKFLQAASRDPEGGSMTARFIEVSTSTREGCMSLAGIMQNISMNSDEMKDFLNVLNMAHAQPEGAESLAKSFSNLIRVPGGAESLSTFITNASSTGQNARMLSQVLASMAGTREGAQQMANLLGKLTTLSPESQESLLYSFSQMSSTQEGAYFLSQAMASTAMNSGGAKVMARILQGSTLSGEGMRSLQSSLNNMSSSPEGAANGALFMERASSTGEGAEALAKTFENLTRSKDGADSSLMTRALSNASYTAEGSMALAKTFRNLCKANDGAEIFAQFMKSSSTSQEGGVQMSRIFAQIASAPEGAKLLSDLLIKLSTASKASQESLLESFKNMSLSAEGAKNLGRAMAGTSVVPEGARAASRLIQMASSTNEGCSTLFGALKNMTSSSEGAHAAARFLKSATSDSAGAESLGKAFSNLTSSPAGTRDMLSFFSRVTVSRESAALLSSSLNSMSGTKGSEEHLLSFIAGASNDEREGRALSTVLNRISSTQEGASNLNRMISRLTSREEQRQSFVESFVKLSGTNEGAKMLGGAFTALASQPQGGASLGKVLSLAGRSAEGTSLFLKAFSGSDDKAGAASSAFVSLLSRADSPSELAKFLTNTASSDEHIERFSMLLKDASREEGNRGKIGQLMQKASAAPEGSAALVKIISREMDGSDGTFRMTSLLNSISRSNDGALPLARVLQNISGTAEGQETLSKFINQATKSSEGSRDVSQMLASISFSRDGARALSDILSKLSSHSPQVRQDLMQSFDRMVESEEGAEFLSHAMAHTSSVKEGAGVMSTLIEAASKTPSGVSSLFQSMKNMSASADGARNMSVFLGRGSSSEGGSQALTQALGSMVSTSQGAADMASLLSNASSSLEGSTVLSRSMLNMAASKGGAEVVLSFMKSAAMSERGAFDLSSAMKQMTSTSEGALDLSRMIVQLSRTPKGSSGMLQSLSKLASQKEGSQRVTSAFTTMASSPAGMKNLSHFITQSLSSPDSARQLLSFFNKMAPSSEGTRGMMLTALAGKSESGRHAATLLALSSHSPELQNEFMSFLTSAARDGESSGRVAQFLQAGSSSREGVWSTLKMMDSINSRPESLKNFTKVLSAASSTREGGLSMAKVLGNLCSVPEGIEHITRFFQNASLTPAGARDTAQLFSNMVGTAEGSKIFADIVQKAASQSSVLRADMMKSFQNITSGAEGAELLSSTIAGLSGSNQGMKAMLGFISNAMSTPEGSSALLSSFRSMTSTLDGAASMAVFCERAAFSPEGAGTVGNLFRKSISQADGIQDMVSFLAKATSGKDGRVLLSRTLLNLSSMKEHGDLLPAFINGASQGEKSGHDLATMLSNMAETRESREGLSRIFAGVTEKEEGSRNLFVALAKISSSKEDGRLLSKALLNMGQTPEGERALTRMIHSASGDEKSSKNLYSLISNMASTTDGSTCAALLLQKGAQAYDGSSAFAKMLNDLSSHQNKAMDVASLFSKISSTSEGAAALSRSLLTMTGAEGQGHLMGNFIEKFSQSSHSLMDFSQSVMNMTSTSEGAHNMSQVMNTLISQPPGLSSMLKFCEGLSLSPEGSGMLGTIFAQMASTPEGKAAMSEFLLQSSRTHDGLNMMISTLSRTAESPNGALSLARLFERTAASKGSGENLAAALGAVTKDIDGTKMLSKLFVKCSESEDGGSLLAGTLLSLNDTKNGNESLARLLRNASEGRETGAMLACGFARMSEGEKGAQHLSRLMSKTQNTSGNEIMTLNTFAAIAQSDEGAASLSRAFLNIARSEEGSHNLCSLLSRMTSTHEGASSFMSLLPTLQASQDGAKNVAHFFLRSASAVPGANSLAGLITNVCSSGEGAQQFIKLLTTGHGGHVASKAYAETFATLSATPRGSEALASTIKSTLSSPDGAKEFTRSMAALSNTPDGSISISRFMSNFTAQPEQASLLSETFLRAAGNVEGMKELVKLVEHSSSTPEGAGEFVKTLDHLTGSEKGSRDVAGLLGRISSSEGGVKGLGRTLVNLSYASDTSGDLMAVLQRCCSSPEGSSHIGEAIRNLASSQDGAENMALFLQSRSSVKENGYESMQKLLNAVASSKQGAESIALLLDRISSSEFGVKSLSKTMSRMAETGEGAAEMSRLFERITSSAEGTLHFSSMLGAASVREEKIRWAGVLGEMSGNPENIGSLSRFIGNMNRTEQSRNTLVDFFINASSDYEGARNCARLFDQASTNPELKQQLEHLLGCAAETPDGSGKVSRLLESLDRGRREQVLTGTRSSESAAVLRGGEAHAKLRSDIDVSIFQRPVLTRTGTELEREEKLIMTQGLEAHTRKAEQGLERALRMSPAEKALSTSTMGERGMAFRQIATGVPYDTAALAASQKLMQGGPAAGEHHIAEVAGIDIVSGYEEDDSGLVGTGAEEEKRIETKRNLPFRPIDIYPESILRYFSICMECGNKCATREVLCARCEAAYERQVHMLSAVSVSRAGHYFTKQTDAIEVSPAISDAFNRDDMMPGEVLSLRMPQKFPKYGEFLALAHSHQ